MDAFCDSLDYVITLPRQVNTGPLSGGGQLPEASTQLVQVVL